MEVCGHQSHVTQHHMAVCFSPPTFSCSGKGRESGLIGARILLAKCGAQGGGNEGLYSWALGPKKLRPYGGRASEMWTSVDQMSPCCQRSPGVCCALTFCGPSKFLG